MAHRPGRARLDSRGPDRNRSASGVARHMLLVQPAVGTNWLRRRQPPRSEEARRRVLWFRRSFAPGCRTCSRSGGHDRLTSRGPSANVCRADRIRVPDELRPLAVGNGEDRPGADAGGGAVVFQSGGASVSIPPGTAATGTAIEARVPSGMRGRDPVPFGRRGQPVLRALARRRRIGRG